MAPDYGVSRFPGQRLILASGSPRRVELLRLLSPEFETVTPAVEEGEVAAPEDLVRIAHRKAERVRALRPEGVVVAADTGVFRNGKAYGKPRDLREAWEILRALSGGWHSVFTGLVVAAPGTSREALVETRVEFKPLSDDEIRRYLAREAVLDKAGAYAIQGGAAPFVTRIEGEFFNVMGLPLATLSALLHDVGWQPPAR
ncbi:MAG TPA: Maf family protein [Candidatus Bipolaricaulis sp.]|nr:Maf family protein [Candidatus Bipolaricaulis sp.]HRS13676.1 Maf family protein [Candidatus Bipolaricaulis sp.]HRU21616.1 Maf family protein [Candidatus Bipolaricaulis sp.]